MQVLLTSIDFTNLFRYLIFQVFFTNADLKTRHLQNKICETNEGKIKEQDVPLTQDSTQVRY